MRFPGDPKVLAIAQAVAHARDGMCKVCVRDGVEPMVRALTEEEQLAVAVVKRRVPVGARADVFAMLDLAVSA